MTPHPERLEPGDKIGMATRADRIAFLVDAAAYFTALADALGRASRAVLVAGWEMEAALRLVRPADGAAQEPTLVERLLERLEQEPRLEVHVLCWDAAVVVALDRASAEEQRAAWEVHPRLYFELDAVHAAGACHHEKVVVLDDEVAFIGGLDLCTRRWDTPAHASDEPRRTTPDGVRYEPFHDVHAVLEGPAAQVLGDRLRSRWQRATGERLEAPRVGQRRGPGPWPSGVQAVATDLPLEVVRTDAGPDGTDEVWETEAALIRAIESARSLVFIENQFLTTTTIAAALEARLAQEPRLELVIVLPRHNQSWLEEMTMRVLRSRIITSLRAADAGDQVRVLCPVLPGDVAPIIHSKLLIADDCIAYLGSANLTNRSMRLDTECGVLLGTGPDEMPARPDLVAALGGLRRQLLAEHLGVDAETVQKAEERHDGRLIPAIDELAGDELAGGERTLHRLEGEEPAWLAAAEPVLRLADPEQPLSVETLLASVLEEDAPAEAEAGPDGAGGPEGAGPEDPGQAP